jgi:hypothetical protein
MQSVSFSPLKQRGLPLFSSLLMGGLGGIELPLEKIGEQERVSGVVPPRLFKQHRGYVAVKEGRTVVNGQILITSQILFAS